MVYRTENGVIVGNITNKNKSQNPIAKLLVSNFNKTLLKFIETVNPNHIHEVGAGEGWLSEIIRAKFPVKMRLTDISKNLIEENVLKDVRDVTLVQRSIYDLQANEDSAELVICCEVLEHIEEPELALKKLFELNTEHYLFSVPNEPLWCVLNFLRAKYISEGGNTPGHIQHWSSSAFITMLKAAGFKVLEKRNPMPWTMVLATKA